MELNSQHLANILWAVARVRPKHTVTRAAAIRLLPRCTALLEQFKPQEASSVLLAASKIFGRSHPGGSEEGAAPPPAGQPGEHVQHPQEVLMFCECVERWASPRVRTFSDQSLTNILVALGTLGLSGRRALTPAVEQEVLERAPHLPAGRFIVLFRGLLSNPAVEPTVLQRAAGMMAEKFPLLPQDRWSLARVFSARRSTANMTEEQLLNWCLTMSTDLQVAVQQSACCGGGPPADDLGCEEPPGPSAGRPRYAAGETHFEGSDQQAAAFGGGGPPVADGLGHHACGGPACGAGGTLPQAGALHGGADFNGCAQPSRGPPQQACFEAGRFGQPAAWAPGMSGPPYEREAWPPQQSAAHPAPQMPERHFGSRAPSGAHDGRFECEAWPPQRAPAEAPAWEDRAWPRSRADFRGPAESPPAHQAYQYHRSPAEDAFDDHSAAAHGAAVQASMPASSSSSSSRPRRGNGAPQWQHPDRGGPGGGALGHGDRRPRAAPGSWRQPEGAEAAAPAGAGGWRAEREAPQLPPPARGAGLRMEVRGGRWHPEEQAAGGGWRPGPPDDGEPPGWRPGARGGGWQLETAGDLGWQSAELVEDPEAIYGFSHGWGEVAARRGGPQGYPETWPEDASGGCHAGAQQGEPWPSGGGARGCPAPPAGDDDGAAAAGDAAESQVEHMEAQEFEVRNTFVEAASDREERALKSWAFNFNSAPPMKPAAVPAEGADRAAATAAGGEEAHVRRKAPTSLMPSSLRQRLKTTFMKLDEEKDQEQEDADAASVGNRSQASSTPAAGAGGDPAQS
ncbi:unnamed protein product [Prorocentrum cordatum]|uniref:Uncharacterized protein n=1 Tax=Prorocentrum cordatum TaxID=2364126 RepID=A0ABN9UL46_9DINO|nr:unnamed protein product [Polarella glacialis]